MNSTPKTVTPSPFMPRPVKLFFLISVFLNALALLIEGYLGYVRHLPWPYNSPLLNDVYGGDITVFVERFRHIHTEAFFSPDYGFQFLYPAPIALLYGFYYHFASYISVFEITVVVIAVAAAVWFAWALRMGLGLSWLRCVVLAGGTLLLSYPLAFEYKQLNVEIFICVLVGLGIWFFLRDRMHVAAAFFGIAMAAKLFPIVYLGLFVGRRKFAPALTAIGVAIVTTVLSLRYIFPSVLRAWRGVNQSLASLQSIVVLGYMPEIGTDHSIFAFLKVAISPLHPNEQHLATMYHFYIPIIAVGGLALYFLRIRLLPVINQVLCLYVIAVVVTPSSYDYTLLHLYVPFAVLVFYAFRTREHLVPGLTATFAVLAAVFSIETEIILRSAKGTPHTLEGQLKCLLLLALLYFALRFPFPGKPTLGESKAVAEVV